MAINVKKQNSNMKKTYQNPTIKVIKIQATQQMLAGSPTYGGSTDQTSGNLAPEFDIWDEE